MGDGWSTIGQLSVDCRLTIGRLSVDCRLIVDRYIGRLSAYMSTKATYSTHDPEMGEKENKFSRKGGRVVTRNFRREGGLRRRHLLQSLYYLHFCSGFFIAICLNICQCLDCFCITKVIISKVITTHNRIIWNKNHQISTNLWCRSLIGVS